MGAKRKSSPGWRARRPVHGGPSDVTADHPRAGVRDDRREVSVPATKVEDSLASPRLGKQKPDASLELGQGQLLGQLLPKFLVVLLH